MVAITAALVRTVEENGSGLLSPAWASALSIASMTQSLNYHGKDRKAT